MATKTKQTTKSKTPAAAKAKQGSESIKSKETTAKTAKTTTASKPKQQTNGAAKSKQAATNVKPKLPTAGAKAKSTAAKQNTKKAVAPKPTNETDESKLMKLFEDELKDIYWAENALVKALPKMIKNCSSEELVNAMEIHLSETVQQVKMVEEVFELIGVKAVGKKCDAMAGLILEAQSIMNHSDKGNMRDAAIISAAQKIEHYEIATYGTLRTFARTIGLDKVVRLLSEILEQEKHADLTLTAIAESKINIQAAHEAQK